MNVILVPVVLDCHAHIEMWMSSGTSLVGPLHCTARFFDFIYLFIYCIFLAQHLHQSQQTSWWQLRRHTDWTIRRQARGDNSVALWVGTGDPQDLSASGAGQCHRLCRVLPPSARHLVTPVRATDLRSQTSWTRDGGDDLHFFFNKSLVKILFLEFDLSPSFGRTSNHGVPHPLSPVQSIFSYYPQLSSYPRKTSSTHMDPPLSWLFVQFDFRSCAVVCTVNIGQTCACFHSPFVGHCKEVWLRGCDFRTVTNPANPSTEALGLSGLKNAQTSFVSLGLVNHHAGKEQFYSLASSLVSPKVPLKHSSWLNHSVIWVVVFQMSMSCSQTDITVYEVRHSTWSCFTEISHSQRIKQNCLKLLLKYAFFLFQVRWHVFTSGKW